jgi:hypothetical protein
MRVLRILGRLPRIPYWIYWQMRSWIFPVPTLCRLWLASRYSRRSLTNPDGLVVSLTSYGRRIHTVYLTIESIGRGTLRPSRIILWLDDRNAFERPPATIRRLLQRGLEVRFCRDYGPHKKYYPYVQFLDEFDAPLVTADDDALYPRNWLMGLAQAFRRFPDDINCYRAHKMVIKGQAIEKYENWRAVTSREPHVHHVATGVAGVIYPPGFLTWLKDAGDGFETCCLKADDLWLHAQAVRAGYKVRQIHSRALLPLPIPGAERCGLWRSNIFGGNDQQIESTYSALDIQRLTLRPNEPVS